MLPSNDGAWLHALWGTQARLLQAEVARPVLGDRVLHLPAGTAALGRAAAAHAAAHWRFGGPPQQRAGLKPVQQALFETLEDARVEWLALQELPGLRPLWLPFHRHEAPTGMGFESLLARLARSLLERQPDDRHPWIARVRAEFFARDGRLALATPAHVRAAASRLGNDIGQMRLPFNPRSYVVHAAYRDDGAWLWEAEPSAAAEAEGGAQPLDGTPALYPEWDGRIRRYRADWCQVHTCPAPRDPVRALARVASAAHALDLLRQQAPRLAGRAAAGDEFHAMALLDARLQQLARQAPDERVYRSRVPPREPLAVQLLLDASASTAPWLDRMLAQALACAAALEAAGHASALLSFASFTRHRLEVRHLKHWHERAGDPDVLVRCRAQRSGGSTRIGVALRHAAAQLPPTGRRALLLFSDGEAHDVDVPDPAYLRGDFRRALVEAQGAGIAVRCAGIRPFLQSEA